MAKHGNKITQTASDAFKAISGLPGGDAMKERLMQDVAKRILALRAAEGLTQEEMDRLLQEAFGAINTATQRAKTAQLERLFAGGIKPTSGVGSSALSRIDRGATIAKGKARVSAERLDQNVRDRALSGLLSMPVEKPSNFLPKLLSSAGEFAATYFLSGGNPLAAGGAAAGRFFGDDPAKARNPKRFRDPFYDDPYGGYA